MRFVGALGTDSAAAEAERELHEAGVDCSGVQRLAEHPTGMALIVVDPGGENQIAVGAGANHALADAHVSARVRAAVTDGLDCVLVSTEIPGAAVLAAVREATRAGVRCVLNPAPPIPAVLAGLRHAPILTPNRGELAALLRVLARMGDGATERTGEEPDPGDGARALARHTGAPVCVTLGADGVLVAQPGAIESIPATPASARDTTGAGDTFNGVLAAWLAAGAPVVEAARAASAAASLSVAAVGARAGMPTRAAILDALRPAADPTASHP